ncbi:MAG: GntR family transcriptional regulator [Formivibrio sp.]|nr:GntR family transcriptional regulator [Formivibrio sp.]
MESRPDRGSLTAFGGEIFTPFCLDGLAQYALDNMYPFCMITLYSMGRKRKILDASPTSSVRHRAYMCIHRKIANGDLKAGSAISELDLAKELGSSRTPIREAISQLIAEGLLEQNQGGGVFVVQFTREDILDLCELREALEIYALSKVARLGLMRPDDKERLGQLVNAILVLKDELEKSGETALNADQMTRFIAADFSFHALLIGLSQNARIHKVVNETRLLMRIFSMRKQGHNAADLDRIYLQHKDLVDAIEHKDAAAAVQIISPHLQESQRERLEEFDQHKREASIRNSIPAFMEIYHPFAS